MITFTLKAQKPVVISGYGVPEGQWNRILGDFGNDGASVLFIQEKARMARHINGVYVINLTEESAQKIGNRQIGVVYINNASIIEPPYSEKELITLEVFPINENNPGVVRLSGHYKISFYFCRHYEHQDNSRQSWMKMYDDFECDIIRFLKHPPVGKTLDSNVIEMIENRADSRYTPLIIKNLTNDGEITVKYVRHEHTVPDPQNSGDFGKTYEVIHYKTIRMSDLMREILERIFYRHSLGSWTFDTPAISAPAKEWQIWFEQLLKN